VASELVAVAAEWRTTLALHGSVALAAAWLLARFAPLPPRAAEALWRTAVLAPLVTASLELVPFDAPTLTTPPAERPVAVRDVPPATAPPLAADDPIAAEARPAPAPDRWALDARTQRWIVLACGCAALLGLARLLRARLRLTRGLRDRVDVPAGALRSLFDALRTTARTRRRIRLTASRTLASPIAFGALRPEICLPARALRLPEDAQAAMLAHELAHHVRRDPLWLLAATTLAAVFPWHPLFAVARRRLVRLAEFRADALGARWTDPVAVAACLVEVASWLEGHRRRPAAGFAMAVPRDGLPARVERLLDRRGAEPRGGRTLAVVCSVVLAGSVLALPDLVALERSPHPLPAEERAEPTPPAGPLLRAVAPLLDELAAERAALATEFASLRREAEPLLPDPALERLLDTVATRMTALEQRCARLVEWITARDAELARRARETRTPPSGRDAIDRAHDPRDEERRR